MSGCRDFRNAYEVPATDAVKCLYYCTRCQNMIGRCLRAKEKRLVTVDEWSETEIPRDTLLYIASVHQLNTASQHDGSALF